MSDVALLQQRLTDTQKHVDQLQDDLRLVRAAYADAVTQNSKLKDEIAEIATLGLEHRYDCQVQNTHNEPQCDCGQADLLQRVTALLAPHGEKETTNGKRTERG